MRADRRAAVSVARGLAVRRGHRVGITRVRPFDRVAQEQDQPRTRERLAQPKSRVCGVVIVGRLLDQRQRLVLQAVGITRCQGLRQSGGVRQQIGVGHAPVAEAGGVEEVHLGAGEARSAGRPHR